MAYAVELLLDPLAAEAVRALWERLAAAGIPAPLKDMGVAPHITLAAYEELDPEAVQDAFRSFACEETPEPVTLTSVGTFPGDEGVVYLAPVVTRGLLALHAGFHERFADHVEAAYPHYLPGAWVPHVTLGLHLTPPQLAEAIALARTADLPITGRLDRLEVVRFERHVLERSNVLYELPLGS